MRPWFTNHGVVMKKNIEGSHRRREVIIVHDLGLILPIMYMREGEGSCSCVCRDLDKSTAECKGLCRCVCKVGKKCN